MAKIERELLLQYRYQETDMQVIEKKIFEKYEQSGHKVSEIKKVQVYLKPEEYSAYFVINNEYADKVSLFD